jgi:hypothetical protein
MCKLAGRRRFVGNSSARIQFFAAVRRRSVTAPCEIEAIPSCEKYSSQRSSASSYSARGPAASGASQLSAWSIGASVW